jgi:hypothetical protein
MGQNSEIRFDCTTEEKDKIKSNADRLGLTIKQYILYVSLNSEVKIELKPIGINIGEPNRNKFRSCL